MALDPVRVRTALEAVIADLDYDLHKSIQSDEMTGEDTYPDVVAMFIGFYGEE